MYTTEECTKKFNITNYFFKINNIFYLDYYYYYNDDGDGGGAAGAAIVFCGTSFIVLYKI